MKVSWTSPSNIALVKYWGKFGVQMPKNPSISFTLKNSVTKLSIEALEKKSEEKNISLKFFFEGELNEKFKAKIEKYLLSKTDLFPWILTHDLIIESSNTFPHSSGIASSASSMSALCLSLLSMDEKISGNKLASNDFFKKASELARLASGSASRSVYGGMASWGETHTIMESSDLYATPFIGSDEIFEDYCDSILIVDANEKSVSSRAGHALMENHPFRDQRYLLAHENMSHLTEALIKGDLDAFIEIVEAEALMLHALMMTSNPSYILLKPKSLWLIDKIKNYRLEHNIPVAFTIDAGPNIHLLYPKKFQAEVHAWIEREISSSGIECLHDEVGNGPVFHE